MTAYRIAIYPGDGIGPQVVDQAMRVPQRVQNLRGDFQLDTKTFDWGADYHAQHGVVAPSDCLEILRGFDAMGTYTTTQMTDRVIEQLQGASP